MKLALVLFDYFSFGGLQRGCFLIAEEAARRGHEVRIIAGMWKGDPPEGVPVEVLGNDGWSNVARNRFFFRRWQARRQRESFDGVIGFNKMPGLDVYPPRLRARPSPAGPSPAWRRHPRRRLGTRPG